MPTYVYECAKCGDEFELWQSFSDEPLKRHSGCGGKVTKVLQPVGIVLKGSGFYKNDSRSGGSKRESSREKTDTSEKSDSGAKGDTAPKSDTSPTSGPKKESSGDSGGSSDGAKKPKTPSATGS